MTKSIGPKRALKAGMSPADGRTSRTRDQGPPTQSCDQFGPWVYLDNYKASYSFM